MPKSEDTYSTGNSRDRVEETRRRPGRPGTERFQPLFPVKQKSGDAEMQDDKAPLRLVLKPGQ